MACHQKGMIESPDDEVRKFSAALADARDHVFKLYPENANFRKWLDQDREIFFRAMSDVNGQEFTGEGLEPVGEVARRYYLEPMNLETVAAELWIEPDQLSGAIKADPVLKQYGLRILLRDGGTIKRAAWESPAILPLMHLVARQFGYESR